MHSFVVIGLLALVFLLQRNIFEFKKLFLILLLAILIGAPFFYSLSQIGFIPGRDFSVNYRTQILGANYYHWGHENFLSLRRIVVFIFLFALLEGVNRKMYGRSFVKDPTASYFALILLANEIAINHNLATGYSVQISHLRQYILIPILIFFMVYVGYSFINKTKSEKLFKIGIAVALVLALLANLKKFQTLVEARETHRHFYSGPINFLRGQKEPGVVMTNDISWLVYNYTQHYIFNAYEFLSAADYKENLERIAVFYQIIGLESQDIIDLFDDKISMRESGGYKPKLAHAFEFSLLRKPPNFFQSLQDRELTWQRQILYPEEFIHDLVSVFEEGELSYKYRLDYLLFNKDRISKKRLDHLKNNYIKLFEDDTFIILKFDGKSMKIKNN